MTATGPARSVMTSSHRPGPALRRTTFTAGPGLQTLPLWIFQNLFRPNQAPVVNVAAVVLVVISVLPVYLANRLSGGSAGATTK